MNTIKTTADFLGELKNRYQLKSNYALAKFMGQTDTAIARWMHGKGSFSDETCNKVAILLEIDPAYVIACIHAEREKNEALKNIWERIAETMSGMTVVFVVSVIAVTLTYVYGDIMPASLFDAEGSPLLALAGFNVTNQLFPELRPEAQLWAQPGEPRPLLPRVSPLDGALARRIARRGFSRCALRGAGR